MAAVVSRRGKNDFVLLRLKSALAINGTGYEVFDLDGSSLESHKVKEVTRGTWQTF